MSLISKNQIVLLWDVLPTNADIYGRFSIDYSCCCFLCFSEEDTQLYVFIHSPFCNNYIVKFEMGNQFCSCYRRHNCKMDQYAVMCRQRPKFTI